MLLLVSCGSSSPAATPAPQPTEPATVTIVATPTETNQTVEPEPPTATTTATQPPATDTPDTTEAASPNLADVRSITVSGLPGSYQFSVEIASPDLGCQQYADWWEVLTEEGELLYRRILAHSHTTEQPFTRSGGPVDIAPEEVVWVRGHMNPGGYGGTTFRGSVATGFEAAELSPDFAAQVAEMPPLPSGCAF